MTNQNGKEVLAYINVSDGTLKVEMRDYELNIGCESTDITTMDSDGFQHLQKGDLSVTISGHCVFQDATAEGRMVVHQIDPQAPFQHVRFEISGLGAFEGRFLLVNLSYSDGHDGPECQWRSAGSLDFTLAAS